MKSFTLIFTMCLFLAVSGCASIAGNNSRAVTVKSKPAGATIMVDNKAYGTTPAIITLPTYIYGGKSVTLKKPGYEQQSSVVNTKFQPIALLDILFWPTFLVDAATGSLVKIDPTTTNIDTTLQRA